MAKTKNQFRAWLDKRGLTLQQFATAIPTISFGFATKHASVGKGAPKTVDPRIKREIAEKFPDCPLIK